MIEAKESIIQQTLQYLEKFPDQKAEVNPLLQFLNATDDVDLINRKNFTGHITTSAFIINENATALLLLKHKSLQRWLQPGGHVDTADTSLSASALREACEETGLSADHLLLVSRNIFDVDSHKIPANPRKNEPQHTHHDIRYLFTSSHSRLLNISLDESTDSKWVAITQLDKNPEFSWFGKKLELFKSFQNYS